ncbi:MULTISPECIES: response regulator transcription factor [Vagococcus]|uniref:Phosphate regulon transcriptional regulatory protein PhoB (SphR) n=1 Tax=Vagococcus fluvialis bH819 TaxID=1255619 RepID=A0A1X6WPA1_9ENTE|nr:MULTISPECIES: response regulator transcription factor [Vagococcus]SLM86161.1 Phosphate regulon transcriptional regulatory protein PhoB (SphR) [Vagococcus fluvialis bH819]HCM90409.1 DNA-binding response regulator [Vagococcus sp.]
MVHILLVEDEEMLSEIVSEFLVDAGFEVTIAIDGEEGLNKFNEQIIDLVLLDIMLPKISGLDVLKKIRKLSNVPIIMMTALDDEYTQLASFNQEIDDYITKPFSPSILVKRIETVLRRCQQVTETKDLGDLFISYENYQVSYQGHLIDLTKKEFEILACLTKRPNIVIPRGQIIYIVWGYQDNLDNRLLDNHFKNIRKKIPEINIQTVTGIGYKLEVPL